MPASIENLKASAVCSSSSVKVNQNMEIKGVHTGLVKNTGQASISGTITVSIKDDDGHGNSNSLPFDVDAGDSYPFSYETPILVSYQKVGKKTATATTVVKAGDDKSASGTCAVEVQA